LARILLIDDEISVLQFCTKVLEKSGHSVDPFKTLREGQDAYRPARYDLVITDGVLPDGNGADFAADLASVGQRTLFISGNISLPEDVLEKGVAVLAKPFLASALMAKVQEILKEEKPE